MFLLLKSAGMAGTALGESWGPGCLNPAPAPDSALLYHVRERYFANHIYTNIGPILLALNPFTFDIPHYKPDQMERYIREGVGGLYGKSAQLPRTVPPSDGQQVLCAWTVALFQGLFLRFLLGVLWWNFFAAWRKIMGWCCHSPQSVNCRRQSKRQRSFSGIGGHQIQLQGAVFPLPVQRCLFFAFCLFLPFSSHFLHFWVLVVSPWLPLPSLAAMQMRLCRRGVWCGAHSWCTAHEAYWHMRTGRENQSILVSGEQAPMQ